MKKLAKIMFLGIFILFAFICTTNVKVQAAENCTSVRASHILIDSQVEAQALKTRINNGESFEALAKKYSKCPSGENGGDLGYFERGQMVKEFEDVAFNLPLYKVSDPVHTQFGWHLIKVYDRK